jgi:Undecaprenyl-phosphate galactose phosphotransferase WbaP
MAKRTSSELSVRSLRRKPSRAPLSAPGILGTPLPWRSASASATVAGFLVADAAAFALCVVSGAFGSSSPTTLAAAALWIVLRAAAGLYDAVSLAPPEELRRSFLSTAVACVAHAGVLWLQGLRAGVWPAVALWVALLVIPWIARQLTRYALLRARLYGAPVIVVGAGATAAELIDELQKNPEQGLHPVAVFDNDPALRGSHVGGIPVVGNIEDAAEFEFPYAVDHALIAVSPADTENLRGITDRFAARFAHVHVTPEFVSLANLWVRARAIGPLLTLEFRHDRVTPFTLRLKRSFDVVLGVLLFLAAAPLILICAALVKLFSPGPAFFSHVREGHRGRLIHVWKIRTMVPDAELKLHEHLRENSSARREWAERVKLGSDPRIIPGLGAFLRRWSLDELPQLWNVVNGSMSLVGPRPFPEYHLDLFPTGFRELRRHVPPGVTGLWQVTYRTDGDLTHQQAADSYYVHNWTLWLDVWILLRTVRVVFSGSGT